MSLEKNFLLYEYNNENLNGNWKNIKDAVYAFHFIFKFKG